MFGDISNNNINRIQVNHKSLNNALKSAEITEDALNEQDVLEVSFYTWQTR